MLGVRQISLPSLPRRNLTAILIALAVLAFFGLVLSEKPRFTGRSPFIVLPHRSDIAPSMMDTNKIVLETDRGRQAPIPSSEASVQKERDTTGAGHEFPFSPAKMPLMLRGLFEAVQVSVTSIAGTPKWRGGNDYLNRYAHRMERLARIAGDALRTPPILTFGLTNLARIYAVQGREQDAISLLESALDRAGDTGERDNYHKGVIANRLAVICAGAGRPASAEAHFRQAIIAFENSGDVGGAYEANALQNLAILYLQQRRHSEAAASALRALSLLDQKTTPARSRVDLLETLGAAYRAQGLHKEAEPFALEAFWIAHEQFKPSDERLWQLTANLAVIYKDEERFSDAAALFADALQEAEVARGPDDIWVGMIANRLAVTYLELGKIAEAEALLTRAAAIGEDNSGADPLFLSAALFNLSAVYVRQSRFKEAEGLLLRSLSIRQKTYDPGHPAVAEVKNALQLVQTALNQQSKISAVPLRRPRAGRTE